VRGENWKTWRNGAGPGPGRMVCPDTEAGAGAGMPTGEGEPERAHRRREGLRVSSDLFQCAPFPAPGASAC
jgi:hypothetical protein